MIRVLESSSGEERLTAAREFVRSFPPATETLLLGASRDAIDDFARQVSADAGGTFGLYRFTITQLAARLAAPEFARLGLAPATSLGSEAVTVRATFEAHQAGRLRHFAPVARFPGFARTLARTLRELRLARVDADAVASLGEPGRDLAALLRAFEGELTRTSLADRFMVFREATRALQRGPAGGFAALPVLLLDVPIDSPVTRDFLAALTASSPAVLATVPLGDEQTAGAIATLGAVERVPAAPVAADSCLARLRHFLFSPSEPPRGDVDEQVCFFSAPGEGRECVEIARWVLDEARRGVRFDEMAILLRTPETYAGLLEVALRRAGVPAFFCRGTRRPDPSGRAFLALLACAAEGLSARRFAEYLSLGQVPAADRSQGPRADAERWVAAEDDVFGVADEGSVSPDGETVARGNQTADESEPPDGDQAPVLAGTLRAPWKWEALLVEAAVVGGRQRWIERLDGLDAELRLKYEEAASDETGSARSAAIERERRNLEHLRRFALPIIEQLDSWPSAATWGEWGSNFECLAPVVLRQPDGVLAVLADLRPAAPVGPVSLDEVRAVLTERLSTLTQAPPKRRYGRVFIGTPEQARGRSFTVVFVPGLAERIFPQRPREDPILLDSLRLQLAGGLAIQRDRGQHERQLLRLAVNAATGRIYLSYPRIEVAESRPRVPSFYGLDVARASTGSLPDFEDLEHAAAAAGQARLAWPAPPASSRAIDAIEHDLAILGPLLHQAAPTDVHGRARYLLELNPHLARSLRARWRRWRQRQWSPADGLVKVTDTAAAALSAHRLGTRPYSVSELQKFAVCPYQFLLSAIFRLEPREEIVSPEQMDPLTRGTIFHRAQAETMRALERSGLLPITGANVEDARRVLDDTIDRVAADSRAQLAPAILRVWQDGVEQMRADLRVWLNRYAANATDWEPIRFEFGFGLPLAAALDPRSHPDPVLILGRYHLRGSVDLIERHRRSGDLRVVDHKTGANRTTRGMIVGGGETLQPVLYSLAIETATGDRVADGRLSFCTAAGGFSEAVVRIDERARAYASEVLAAVDRAIERGFLVPAPRPEACAWCDFREVCGPYEEIRMSRKDPAPLGDLHALREMP